MPRNQLRIQRQEDGSFQATVWKPNGDEKDLTSKFAQITGPEAPSLFAHKITLKDTTYNTVVEFTAKEFDLKFTVEPDVARQLAVVAGD
jgi:hypothetical protein